MTLVPLKEWLPRQNRATYRNRTINWQGGIINARTPEPNRGIGKLIAGMHGKRPPYRRLPGERGQVVELSASSLADRRIAYRAAVADLMNEVATKRRIAWEKSRAEYLDWCESLGI